MILQIRNHDDEEVPSQMWKAKSVWICCQSTVDGGHKWHVFSISCSAAQGLHRWTTFCVLIHARLVPVVASSIMRCVFQDVLGEGVWTFHPEQGQDNHMFPKQNRFLLSREGFAASAETFQLWTVGVVGKNFDVRPARIMNCFTVCRSISSVIERVLSKVTG